MKRLIRGLLVFILLFIGTSHVYAKNIVNIYLFHSDTCPHCREEIGYLDKIQERYDNVVIHKYEIGDSNNAKLMAGVALLYDTNASGVPFTVIGDKYFLGFTYEGSYDRFIAAIDYYSENEYEDRVGAYIGTGGEDPEPEPVPDEVEEPIEEPPVIEEPTDTTDTVDVDTYIEERTERKITIFGKTISLKNMALPLVAIIIGLVDGFNPCAMWVLLFLISILIGMKDRKRMWVLGLTFLITSAVIYLLFMLAWLNAATLLLSINYVRFIIGLIAIIGAIINISSYIKHRKDNGCNVIDDNKRNKIFDKIKKFTHEKSYMLAIIGAMTLAISVNIVELACSAGLPVMFIQILSMNDPSIIEKIVYIALYMICFLLDDLIVFFIAMRTMELTGFSTKYGKLSKLIGGLLLLGIGILLICKPEWLMFNF